MGIIFYNPPGDPGRRIIFGPWDAISIEMTSHDTYSLGFLPDTQQKTKTKREKGLISSAPFLSITLSR